VTSSGTVITFYSYKGGTGRTMALANVGALLSNWGYRVLCLDWDLEAPGLHLYFERWSQAFNAQGLVEFIDARDDDWRNYVTEVWFPGAPISLHFIPAGRFDETYVQRMQGLDWPLLYEKYDLGSRLESLREEWKEEYDFVLIDSRTGVTDIGGICTIQMPDQLVLLFTANHQSLGGTLEVAKRAAEQRNHLPFDRAGLSCVPVPSRFEGLVEMDLKKEWLDIFADRLEPLYRAWADQEVFPRQLLDLVRIPYVAYWSFGEKMPVLDEGTKAPETIGFAIETLAALLAHRLAGTALLVRNRDEFVDTARQVNATETTLRLVQSAAAEDLHRVEISFEGQGTVRQSTTSIFPFLFSEDDQRDLRWYLEDYLQAPEEPAPRIAARVERRISEIGAELFNAIFNGRRRPPSLGDAPCAAQRDSCQDRD